MRHTVVRYRTKPDRAEENEQLVRAVYAELEVRRPAGLRYITFRLDDGATFVHVAIEDGDGPSPLPQLPAFERFTAGIADRCEEQPVVIRTGPIGSYGF